MASSPLRSIMQKIFPEQSLESASAPVTQTRLDDLLQAYEPLLELQDQHRFIEVEVLDKPHTQTYQSMVLHVDFYHREILLDTLTPGNPFYPVIEGDTLLVSYRQQQRVISFSGRVKQIRRDGDGLVYAMELPETVGYKQRRFYPRLDVREHGGPRHVRLLSPNRAPWFGSILDISCGGMQVAVGGNITNQLSHNVLLPSCEFVFNQNLRIQCKANVKAYRYCRRPYEHTKLNLSFNEMGFQQRLRLQNHITFLLDQTPTLVQN